MATPSRSPLSYQKRKGLEPTPTEYRSRFAPCDLLVNHYPTGNTVEKAQLAEGGGEAPDRAKFFIWPTVPNESED